MNAIMIALVAAAGLAASPAAGQDGGPLVPLFLYLPDDSRKVQVPMPAEPLVRVERAQFERLLARYNEAAAARDRERRAPGPQPSAPVPVEAVLREAVLTGEVGRDSARLAARIGVTVLGAGPVVLPIARPGVAIESVEVPDPSDRLVVASGPSASIGPAGVPGAGAVYVASGPGERSIAMSVLLPLVDDRSRRQLRVGLPGALRQRLELTIPGPVWGLSVEPGTVSLVQRGLPGGAVRIEAELGPLPEVRVAWTRIARPAGAQDAARSAPAVAGQASPAPAPRLFASAATLHALSDGVVRFLTRLELKGSVPGRRFLELVVPGRVVVRDVRGDLVEGHRLAPSREGTRLVVRLKAPISGPTAMVVEGDLALDLPGEAAASGRQVSRVELPTIDVVGALRVQGVAGLCAFATCGLRLDAARSTGVSPCDPAELPAWIGQAATSPVLVAFRYAQPRPRPVLELERFEPEPGVGVMVQGITAISVITRPAAPREATGAGGLVSLHRMLIKVVSGSTGHLPIHLPRGAAVVACFVDLAPTSPASPPGRGPAPDRGERSSATRHDEDRETVLIPLKRSPLVDGQLVAYPVEIAYRLEVAGRMSLWGGLDLEFPSLGAPVADVSWTLYTPAGFRTYGASGRFRVLDGERELLLVMDARLLFELVVSRGAGLLLLAALGVVLIMVVLRVAGLFLPGLVGGVQPTRAMPLVFSSLIVAGIMAVLAAVSVPNFKAARERGNTRACFANQKTIAGAVEMYNLDKNTRATDLRSLWQGLKAGGYLQTIPQDPGQGTSSHDHYQFTTTGFGIRCSLHGSIEGPR